MRTTRLRRPASPPSADACGQGPRPTAQCGASQRRGGGGWQSNWTGTGGTLGKGDAGHGLLARSLPRGALDPGLRCEQGRPECHEPVLGPGTRAARRLLLRGRPGLRRDRHGRFPAARPRGRGYSLAEPPRARRHPGGGRAYCSSTLRALRWS
jgi:hypothetical protein